MPDSVLGRRSPLNFPSVGDALYLTATLQLGLWTRVPAANYSAQYVEALLREAQRGFVRWSER